MGSICVQGQICKNNDVPVQLTDQEQTGVLLRPVAPIKTRRHQNPRVHPEALYLKNLRPRRLQLLGPVAHTETTVTPAEEGTLPHNNNMEDHQ